MIFRVLAPSVVALLVTAAGPAFAQKASISGELGYPSDYIPDDMRVCAEPVPAGKATCTRKHIKSKRRTMYRLEVEPGDYHVYAETRAAPGKKAYWSEFVRCGIQASCKSHAPILVKAAAGAKLTGINPEDWYE